MRSTVKKKKKRDCQWAALRCLQSQISKKFSVWLPDLQGEGCPHAEAVDRQISIALLKARSKALHNVALAPV